MKNSLWSFALILNLLLLFTAQGCVSLPVSPPGTKPIIIHGHCIEKGRYGDALKIYIDAEDPKGYMLRIATVVDQVGYGLYPTDWIYLKPQYQNHVIGYLQWNTFSFHASRMPEWTQLTIRVSIFDADGNESNEVVFPFEFVSEVIPNPPPPSPFNQENLPRLGYIDINLYNPLEMGDHFERPVDDF